MRRLLLVLGLVAGALFLTPGAALACSCVQSTPAQLVKSAGTIIDGTLEWVSSNGVETTYGITADAVYKGKAAEQEKLVGPADAAACGLGQVATRKRYLFFVKGEHPGRLRVDSCTGTAPYDAALAEKVEAITGPSSGVFVSPPAKPGPTDDDQIQGTSVWTILGTSAAVVVVLGGLLAYSRRTSR